LYFHLSLPWCGFYFSRNRPGRRATGSFQRAASCADSGGETVKNVRRHRLDRLHASMMKQKQTKSSGRRPIRVRSLCRSLSVRWVSPVAEAGLAPHPCRMTFRGFPLHKGECYLLTLAFRQSISVHHITLLQVAPYLLLSLPSTCSSLVDMAAYGTPVTTDPSRLLAGTGVRSWRVPSALAHFMPPSTVITLLVLGWRLVDRIRNESVCFVVQVLPERLFVGAYGDHGSEIRWFDGVTDRPALQ
jgi:hypothetical protein